MEEKSGVWSVLCMQCVCVFLCIVCALCMFVCLFRNVMQE